MASKHSKLGPSSAYRWWECPGSIRLCAQVPSVEAEAAAEGTVAHGIHERRLQGRLTYQQALQLEGRFVPQGKFNIEITREMIEAVEESVVVILSEFERIRRIHPRTQLFVEQRVSLDSVDKEVYGTCDALIVAPAEELFVHVYDYKHGKGVAVGAEDNKQLKIYALGAFEFAVREFYGGSKTLRDAIRCANSIQINIMQPRKPGAEGMQKRVHLTGNELLAFMDELPAKIADTRKADAPLRAGGHCGFCAARGVCIELANAAVREAQVSFDVIPTDTEAKMPIKPELMTVEQLSRAMSWLPILSTWSKGVEGRVFQLLDAGTPVPGFKIVTGKSNRGWKDENAVIANFEALYGDALFERRLLSPSKLEKVVGKTEIVDFVHKPEGARTVAPASDAREERTNTAQFSVINETNDENGALFS